MTVCPSCGAPQTDGLLDATCTLKLEQTLRSVPLLVRELDVTLSKMARIGTPGKSGHGTAREKNPINFGALDVSSNLMLTLVAWAPIGYGQPWTSTVKNGPVTLQAARVLLNGIDNIRRHPEAAKLLDEITDATDQARRVIDRPADRQYLGQCLVEIPDSDEGRISTCPQDLYAKPNADTARCPACFHDHPVAERRTWLLQQASDRLVTIREATTMIGTYAGRPITQAAIRGYLHRGRLTYHGQRTIRLGDLLDVLTTKATA